jgi:hypothetical protein
MPQVGFEPRISALELEKTVRALDRAITVNSKFVILLISNVINQSDM